jgi:NADH-quinone oxidoreductase subunit G
VAKKSQEGIMEFLLINHPLDCPVCDKGGECPLQNQAMSAGRGESRYDGKKRTFAKPVAISSQVLLDRERCVLCARCTRFSNEIAGDPFIELLERGALQQVGIYEDEPFESYFSGNTIQICPVGALTSAAYRFRSRPFDLVSSPSIAEHDAGGAAIRVDHRRGKVMRRLAGDDPEVNEEWISDKDRFAFRYATQPDRLTHPMVRDEHSGELVAASWPEAVSIAARGLAKAKDGAGVGVLTGGRLTLEDAYAYSKFARLALHTNDVDFRARAHSEEEAAFLAGIAGAGLGVTYADLQTAPAVLLAGLEAEEEAPSIFLRLRKGSRKRGTKVFALAPYASPGVDKMNGTLIACAPGAEAALLGGGIAEARDALAQPGALILVGERLAGAPGGYTAASALAEQTGATLAWVPRRAGDRGALEAGLLPNLLPGGRPADNPEARVDLGAFWGSEAIPVLPGRDTSGIIAAIADGTLGGLLTAGVHLADLPDPAAARAALEHAAGNPDTFVVSLEMRDSDITELADVVLPVAPVAEKAGTFVNWEGRERAFEAALGDTSAMSDARVLSMIAREMGLQLAGTPAELRSEFGQLGRWDGEPWPPPDEAPVERTQVGAGQAVLATWRMLLDDARLQDGDKELAATSRRPVAKLSAATAVQCGVAESEQIAVTTDTGTITLQLEITDMVDDVVWLPQLSPGSHVYESLGVTAGDVVTIRPGGEAQ